MSGPDLALLVAAVGVGVALAPRLACASVRLATQDDAARAPARRAAVFAVLLAALLAGVVVRSGARPASLALAWAAGAALVLAAVDLAVHRLPDAVTLPAVGICAAALLLDALVLHTWAALLRAVLAAAVTFGGALVAGLISPDALGMGDVKLLALIGLLLGWFGWDVLLSGIFFGLVAGGLGAIALLLARRVGWRTAIAYGPPLLLGAAVAIATAPALPL